MTEKNKAAVALGKLKRGVKERPSELKHKSAAENLKIARLTRWNKETK